MWQLLLLLIVLLVAFVAFRRRQPSRSASSHTVIEGRRVHGRGKAASLGYPTVNIVLSQPVSMSPGMYLGENPSYGRAVLLLLGQNCECHFLQWNPDIDRLDTLRFHQIQAVPAPKGSIVDVFNRGAKNLFASASS